MLFELGVNFLDETETDLARSIDGETRESSATVAGLRAESGAASDPLFWILLAIGATAMLLNWCLLAPGRTGAHDRVSSSSRSCCCCSCRCWSCTSGAAGPPVSAAPCASPCSSRSR